MEYYILVVNPGSTSTKLAVYRNKECVHEKNISHSTEELSKFSSVMGQKEFRLNCIFQFLAEINVKENELSAVVGRGGAIGPISSGAYKINDRLVDRLENRPVGLHASNLGGVLAYTIAAKAGIPAYTYDGVTVDELPAMARITGIDGVVRYSRCHALNMRASAIMVSEQIGKKYADCNFIVAHMGGGITMSAHNHGRMVDVLIDSEGPLSPERAGALPATTLLKYMLLKNISPADALKMTRGKGGMVSLLGTNSALEVVKRIESGDEKAKLVLDAMCYQTAKGIGALAATLKGTVDRIIITGALARDKIITSPIEESVKFIAPVVVVPGEREMEALAFGALRVLTGEEQAHEYDEATDTIDPNIV